VWVGAALLISGLASFRIFRTPMRYESKVVLRVTEGRVEFPGAKLGGGRLRSYVDNLALTNKNLLAVMGRHGGHFGEQADPASALEDFRKDMEIGISENDFNEERGSDDPPRSARLEIGFHSGDPELAHEVARQLAELVISSAFGHQRQVLEHEREAATVAAKRADADLAAFARVDPMGLDPHTAGARQRAIDTKESVAASVLALRALDEKQVLRFEVVDPGRVPATVDPLFRVLGPLVFSLLGALLAGALLAGAFDPRVVDVEDLTSAGSAVLGHVPALPWDWGSTGGNDDT